MNLVHLSEIINCRELLDTAVITWHRMRGTQMIAAVKIISIAFDLDRKKIRQFPNFLEFWGYILCPGNVIMGPWCAYNDYLYLFHRTKFVSWKKCVWFVNENCRFQGEFFCLFQSFAWIFQALLNGMIAIFFLLASNCYIDAYVPTLHAKWVSRIEFVFQFVIQFSIVLLVGVPHTRVHYHFVVAIISCASYHIVQCCCLVLERFEIKNIIKYLAIR